MDCFILFPEGRAGVPSNVGSKLPDPLEPLSSVCNLFLASLQASVVHVPFPKKTSRMWDPFSSLNLLSTPFKADSARLLSRIVTDSALLRLRFDIYVRLPK